MLKTFWNGFGGKLAFTLVLAVIAGLGAIGAAAQEEAAEQPPVREGDWVEISFGTGIDKTTRALVGEAGTFAATGERVFCLTRVHGLQPPTTVTHAWYHEGRTMARVDLPVGSENWRTWSSKTYLPTWTGSWEVKVLDQDGRVLGSALFEVVE